MSIWKASKEQPVGRATPVEKKSTVAPATPVEVTALEIVADPELGCDPYNSTGQFLAEELKRYQD